MVDLFKGAKRVIGALVDKTGSAINPATIEKQDIIITALNERVAISSWVPYTTALISGTTANSGWIEATDENGERWGTVEFLINSDYTTEVMLEQSNDGSTVVYSKKYRNLFRNSFRVPILAKYIKITLTNVSDYDQTRIYFDAYFSNADKISQEKVIIKGEIDVEPWDTGVVSVGSVLPSSEPTSPQVSLSHDFATIARIKFDKNGERITKKLKRYMDTATLSSATPDGMIRIYTRTHRLSVKVTNSDSSDHTVDYSVVVNAGKPEERTITGSFTATNSVQTEEIIWLVVDKLTSDTDTIDITMWSPDGSDTYCTWDSYENTAGMGSNTIYHKIFINNLISNYIRHQWDTANYFSATSTIVYYGYFDGIGEVGVGNTIPTSEIMSPILLTIKNSTANDGLTCLKRLYFITEIPSESLILTED